MEEIKQLDQQESEQIFKLPNSWREKGIAEGIQKEKRQTAKGELFNQLEDKYTR